MWKILFIYFLKRINTISDLEIQCITRHCPVSSFSRIMFKRADSKFNESNELTQKNDSLNSINDSFSPIRQRDVRFRQVLWTMWKDPTQKNGSFHEKDITTLQNPPPLQPKRAAYWTHRAAPLSTLFPLPTLKVTTCFFRRKVTNPTKKRWRFIQNDVLTQVIFTKLSSLVCFGQLAIWR